MFQADFKGTEDHLTAQMQRDGIKPVGKVAEKPKLPTGLILYYEAFNDLDTERPGGMALLPIPWSAIVRYAEYYELDIDEALFFVRKIDNAFMERMARDLKGGQNTTRPSKADAEPSGED